MMLLPLLDLQKSCSTPARGVHPWTELWYAHVYKISYCFCWPVDSKYLHFAVGRGAYTRDKTTYAGT